MAGNKIIFKLRVKTVQRFVQDHESCHQQIGVFISEWIIDFN